MERDALLARRSVEAEVVDGECVCLITRYGSHWRKLESLLQTHWHVLQLDAGVAEALCPCPMMVAKLAQCLKDALVQSEFNDRREYSHWLNRPYGNFWCGRHRIYQYFSQENFVTSFQIRSFITFGTCFVVYMLSCPCGQ